MRGKGFTAQPNITAETIVAGRDSHPLERGALARRTTFKVCSNKCIDFGPDGV